MHLNHAIKGILRTKVFTLLLVMQIVFAFYAFYNVLEINHKVNEESTRITKFFKHKKIFKLQEDEFTFTTGKVEDPIRWNQYMKEAFNILQKYPRSIFTYTQQFDFIIESFKGYEPVAKYTPLYQYDGKKFFYSNHIAVNEATIKHFDIQLEKGRLFEAQEYERKYSDTNVLPIIVGSEYEKYFKVGDELLYRKMETEHTVKARIIGIMKENQYLPRSGGGFSEEIYINLNKYILTTPAYYEYDRYMYLGMLSNNYFLLDEIVPTQEIKQLSQKITKTFDDTLGIKVLLRNHTRYITAELNRLEQQRKIMLTAVITIFIFLTVTLIFSILSAILKRKKEFGVHIFSGGTLKDIAIAIYLEVLLILLISFIIAMLIIFYQTKTLNLSHITILLLNLIAMSIITTIIPITKLFKFHVSDMIKGTE